MDEGCTQPLSSDPMSNLNTTVFPFLVFLPFARNPHNLEPLALTMMNTKEAARKWECSIKTVTKLCADGVIPLAEKDERSRWIIQNECEKPPVSRFRLCYLMDMINQLKEGVVYKHIKWGISEKELVEGYKYLIENAMVSSFDVHQLEKELPKATVTSRGKALMERENKEGSSQRKFNINFKINTGVFSFETGYENTKGK